MHKQGLARNHRFMTLFMTSKIDNLSMSIRAKELVHTTVPSGFGSVKRKIQSLGTRKMEMNCEEEVIPFAVAIEVDAHQTDQNEPNEVSDILPVASESSNDTINLPYQLHGAQSIPPKIQEKISRELELNEQVLYTKILSDCNFFGGMMFLFIGAVHLGVSFFLFTLFANMTVDLVWVFLASNALLFGMSGVYLIGSQISDLISKCFTKISCAVYAITNNRIITVKENTIRSFLIKDLSDIIIRGNDVVYFQEWLTDPDGNPILNELTLPSLDQDGREIVAMLNFLKERVISANPAFDYSQLSNSINVDQIIRPIVLPPHLEVDINGVLQAEERVVKTVRPVPKHCIFRSPLDAIPLSFFFLYFFTIGIGWIISMFYMIPFMFVHALILLGISIFGLLVISKTIQAFRDIQKVVYIITDRRVIRIRPRNWLLRFISPPFYEFPTFQPYHVFRRDYPNGTGDVFFAHRWWGKSRDGRGGFIRRDDGFFGIANPKDIEKTLKTFATQMSTR